MQDKPTEAFTMPPTLNGLWELVQRYDGYIIDLFGVLYDGRKVFPGVTKALDTLHQADKKLVLLSNTPHAADFTKAQMQQWGINPSVFSGIVTSGEMAFQSIHNPQDEAHKTLGQRYFAIGQPWSDLFEKRLTEKTRVDTIEDADFVLLSNPEERHHDHHIVEDELSRMAEMKLPMICACPDLIVAVGHDLHMTGGTIAKRYEEQYGGQVMYHGKPYAPAYKQCEMILDIENRDRIVCIGDALRTDVAGGASAGFDTVFNLPGIHWQDIVVEKGQDEICKTSLSALIENADHKPTYLLNGFKL